MGTVIVNKSGPNLLIRFVWWLFIGWWASGIVVGITWIAFITIVGIPLGIWLINRLPTVLTLRPRTRAWSIGQDEDGRTIVSEGGRPQISWPIRGIWFVLIWMVSLRPLDGGRLARSTDDHWPTGSPPHVQSDTVRCVPIPILNGEGHPKTSASRPRQKEEG